MKYSYKLILTHWVCLARPSQSTHNSLKHSDILRGSTHVRCYLLVYILKTVLALLKVIS